MKRFFTVSILFCVVVSMVSCKSSHSVAQTITAANNTKQYVVKVEKTLPHSTSRYTQGLFFDEGSLYESAGQYGESAFYKTDFESDEILSELKFPDRYFLEGSCILDGKLYILTWNEHVCFVYDKDTMEEIDKLTYKGEGWGLTTDGEYLVMSDGSSIITFRDPETFAVKKQIPVTLMGKELTYLNELEYIDGKIWANVYTSDKFVIINPLNGVVEGTVNCANLLSDADKDENTDVLNGIAYNPADGSIYITGKNWPKMFKISLVEL